MKDIKVIDVLEAKNLVKVTVIARNFLPTKFIFTDNEILCYGDIASFTWCCTWDTAQQILLGNCYATNPYYLTEKLEHKSELQEFDDDLFVERMEEIKQDYLSSFDTDEEKDEFLEKWEDNEYLLSNVDGYRLADLDSFFDEMEIADGWEYYGDFYKLPDQYNCALEFLVAIENYFKERAK